MTRKIQTLKGWEFHFAFQISIPLWNKLLAEMKDEGYTEKEWFEEVVRQGCLDMTAQVMQHLLDMYKENYQ